MRCRGEEKAEKNSVLLTDECKIAWHIAWKLPALAVSMGDCKSRWLKPSCLLLRQHHRDVPCGPSRSVQSLI